MKCDEIFGDGGGGDTGGVCVESVGWVVWVEREADEYAEGEEGVYVCDCV